MEQTYPLLASQRRSRLLLGLICVLFVVTAPIGIILLVLSQRKFVIAEGEIRVRPFGKTIRISEIEKWGLGSVKNLLPSQSAMNPSGAPQHVSVRVGLIQLHSGKQMGVSLANYPQELESALLSVIPKKPQVLMQKGLRGLRFK